MRPETCWADRSSAAARSRATSIPSIIPGPVLTITDNRTGTVNAAGGDILFTFTFDTDVTGFTDGDVTVGHGTKGAFTALDARTYTLAVTPDAGFEGNVTVDVAADAAQDSATNGNDVATHGQAVDTLAPAAANDAAAVAENATRTGNVIAGAAGGAGQDIGTGIQTVTAISGSGGAGTVSQALIGALGTLTLNPDGSYSYAANRADALAAGVTATDTFTYTVADAVGNTDTADLVVTVTGVNDAPTGTHARPDHLCGKRCCRARWIPRLRSAISTTPPSRARGSRSRAASRPARTCSASLTSAASAAATTAPRAC